MSNRNKGGAGGDDAADDFTVGTSGVHGAGPAAGGSGVLPAAQPAKSTPPPPPDDDDQDDDAGAATKPSAEPTVSAEAKGEAEHKCDPRCGLPAVKMTTADMNAHFDAQNRAVRDIRRQDLARNIPEFRELMEENAALIQRIAELEAAKK